MSAQTLIKVSWLRRNWPWIVFIVLVVGMIGLYVGFHSRSKEWTERGTFGDSFGVFGQIGAVVALLFTTRTLVMQNSTADDQTRMLEKINESQQVQARSLASLEQSQDQHRKLLKALIDAQEQLVQRHSVTATATAFTTMTECMGGFDDDSVIGGLRAELKAKYLVGDTVVAVDEHDAAMRKKLEKLSGSFNRAGALITLTLEDGHLPIVLNLWGDVFIDQWAIAAKVVDRLRDDRGDPATRLFFEAVALGAWKLFVARRRGFQSKSWYVERRAVLDERIEELRRKEPELRAFYDRIVRLTEPTPAGDLAAPPSA